jgi:glycosyltransferase involved in cell wall biosynthesis
MVVLMVSSDRNILRPGSAVSERMKEYGKLVDGLHIVLMSDKTHRLSQTQISKNVWVYPTNSSNKFFRPLDAVKIGDKIPADLITAQDPFECGWAGLKIKERNKIPLEVQLHTDPFSGHFSGFLNFVRKRIARRVLRKADSVRVVSESLKSRIRHPNVYVLPIYIDRSRIEEGAIFDLHNKYGFKSVVLAVSRLSAEKNVRMAIEAVSKIPDTGLVIVGDGPEREKFKETDRVKFVGWQENLASYYKTADIFIQTSKFEGYGLSLVEAGLSGLPVVTTPVGIAEDLENVIIAETKEELTRAVRSLVSDHTKSKILGQNLKKELEAKILTKENYLDKLRENWLRTAKA